MLGTVYQNDLFIGPVLPVTGEKIVFPINVDFSFRHSPLRNWKCTRGRPAESLFPERRTSLSCAYRAGILLHCSRLQRRWDCCCDLPAGCVEAYPATAALVLLGDSPSSTVSGVCTGFACRRRSRCSAFKRLRASLLRASHRKLSGCFG